MLNVDIYSIRAKVMDERISNRDSKFYGLDVNSEFLLPFLSPTSWTNWWDSPPNHIVHDRYVGRAQYSFTKFLNIC